MPPASPLDTLGEFVARTSYGDLPVDIADATKLKILDALSCLYAGRAHETSGLALRLAARLAPGSVPVLSTSHRLAPQDAAFVNSAMIHAILQDDVDLESGHPACTVIASALAAGEAAGAPGCDIVAATALGYEVMWRVGGCGAFLMRATQRGFRGNTILGCFGSAAAAAKVLGLDANGVANALGAAGSFAAGILEPLNTGAMERCFQQAANTRQGMMAAFLAADGIDACRSCLEGPTGVYRAFADLDRFPAGALDTLGREYRLPAAFAKPYPSAGSNTVGIAVAELVCRRHAVSVDEISDVDVKVLPRFTGVPGYPSIAYQGPFTTIEQALISFPFEVACMLKCREVTLAVIQRELGDPVLHRLAQRVHLIGVDVPHPLWCAVEVKTRSGRTYGATSDEIDWGQFYHTREAAWAKFLRETSGHVSAERARQVFDCACSLDALSTMTDMTRLLAA